MGPSDEELIASLSKENEELRTLVNEHKAFEAQLEQMAGQRYLTDQEQREMAAIKKRKLRGKERIYRILDAWRSENL